MKFKEFKRLLKRRFKKHIDNPNIWTWEDVMWNLRDFGLDFFA